MLSIFLYFVALMQERFFDVENFNDELTMLGLTGLKQVNSLLLL